MGILATSGYRCLKETERRNCFFFFFSTIFFSANMKLIFLFSLVIAIGLSSGFIWPGKDQKQKSALKQKLENFLIKTKNAKQLRELRRQNVPNIWGPAPPSLPEEWTDGELQYKEYTIHQTKAEREVDALEGIAGHVVARGGPVA